MHATFSPAPLPADVKYSSLNVAGIALGLVGSVTYSAVSYLESASAKAPKARESPPASLRPPGPASARGGAFADALERTGLLNGADSLDGAQRS